MEAIDPWKPLALHSSCPVCARRATPDIPRPSVQRAEDGVIIDADVLRGDSLADAGVELDELPTSATDIVAIRIPRFSRDDVMQLRIPRACMASPPVSDAAASSDARTGSAHTVVLPNRWYLLEASLPTVVSRTTGGCTRIEFDAPADETVDVVFTIVRHSLATAV